MDKVQWPTVSQRIAAVQRPIIPIIADLIRDNSGTISLGQGVVHYGPPPQAWSRLQEFIQAPENKYGSVRGFVPLIDKIRQKITVENNIPNQGNQIIVTAGGNMAFLNAILAIADPGDEIILLTPYYFNHEMAIRMIDCQPVLVSTDTQFHPVLDAVRSAITTKTRAIVTISPNNPTGAVYSKQTLRDINTLCRDRGIYHISDEAYEYFTYGPTTHYSPAADPLSTPYTISLYSLSKAYGFASWRIGYMVVPQHLTDAILKIQDTNLICAVSASQYAALGALEAGRNFCIEQSATIRKVRQITLAQITQLDFLKQQPTSDGALYVFLEIDSKQHPMGVIERLIKEFKVAALPGSAFGLDSGCQLRVSFGALEEHTAEAGINRLVQGLRIICQESR